MTRLLHILPLFVITQFVGCASMGPLNPMRPIERRLVFQPTKSEEPEVPRGVESVRIPVNDQEFVHGLYVPHSNPVAVVLFCHGNAGNISHRLPRLRQLSDRYQISILGFDYRGYGASPGSANETQIYEDARAARKWLADRNDVLIRDIVLMGRSLGGAVAVELATNEARGLILESTFSSITDVGKTHARFLPVSFLMESRFSSIDKIARYHGPLLQVHGTADNVVPFSLGEELHAAANEPRRFLSYEGGHNTLPGESYSHALEEFLANLRPLTSASRHSQSGASPTRWPEFNCVPESWQRPGNPQ